jgi:hypothetical protein
MKLENTMNQTMFRLLCFNDNDLTDHDLAHLADWANGKKNDVANPMWQRAYALLREGADLLLRRRAMNEVPACEPDHEIKPCRTPPENPHLARAVDYFDLRVQTGDFQSTFYGPHSCSKCKTEIIKQAEEQGGSSWEWDGQRYTVHMHGSHGPFSSMTPVTVPAAD